MNTDEYKKHLFHPKTDNYILLGHLKQEGDYDKIKKVYRSLISHPFVKNSLKINSLPKDYSDIRKQKPVPFSGNFIGESSFYLLVLEENKEIITSFISLKDKYETEFLIGNYDYAEALLIEIEKLSGKSIWLIENQILLKEYREGVKSNWSEVSELSNKVNDPFVLFFIENLSKKAESKISFFRYLNIFNNQVNEIITHQELYEYLCFRLNYLAFSGYNNLAYYLFAESSSSIIDRYLIFKDVLSEMFSDRFKEHKNVLFSISSKLYELFPNDIQLIQILSLLSPNYIKHLPVNEDINQLFRDYSIGNYSDCIECGASLILENPTIIEIYEIYVKSTIEKGIDLNLDEFPNNIKNILFTLYGIYSNHESFDQQIDSGLKYCTSFSSTSWAKQFLSLINSAGSINNGNKLFSINYLINSRITNPRILYFANNELIDDYISILSSNTDLVDTTQILSYIIKGQYNEILHNKILTQSKKDLYYVRSLIRADKFQEAKEHLELISTKHYISTLFLEEVIVNLFRCYIKLGLNKEACCLFVENYLKSKEITKRLNRIKLLDSLEAGDIEKVSNLIELPIFYKIASIDSYQQYVAYDTFLESKSVVRPSELITNFLEFDYKMIYFLKEVCSIEIMHHSYHFNGTDDIENERLEILNKLIVSDTENEDNYIKEITELNQNSNIRKAIREVNKGRISVNIQQLRNNEINNIKEAFNRYKEIEIYSKNKELVGIDTSINMMNELTNQNLEELLGE